MQLNKTSLTSFIYLYFLHLPLFMNFLEMAWNTSKYPFVLKNELL